MLRREVHLWDLSEAIDVDVEDFVGEGGVGGGSLEPPPPAHVDVRRLRT